MNVILALLLCLLHNVDSELQTNGYILYCPCMGRFGNQAEQFLGSIAFAKGVNRTLVLPPWVTYPPSKPFSSHHVSFDEWFKVAPLKQYYSNVMLMQTFMDKHAPQVWPPNKRIGFCYTSRGKERCPMKEGNPFGPFWNRYNVDFVSTLEHRGLLWNVQGDPHTLDGWLTRFPASNYPVLAFQGAPGDFPSLSTNMPIQKHIEFSDKIISMVEDFVQNKLGGKRFVGIHLRNGMDMLRVCDDLDTYPSDIFASSQCTKHARERKLTRQMCNPSKKDIIKQVMKFVKLSKARALFVATDNDPMLEFFARELTPLKVSVHSRRASDEDINSPIVDIALLSRSDFFIGNCLSTFSAFVRRHKESRGDFKFAFFGIDIERKEEL